MFKLDAEATMVFHVLRSEEAILLRKVAEFGGRRIFLMVAGVKAQAERYNRR